MKAHREKRGKKSMYIHVVYVLYFYGKQKLIEKCTVRYAPGFFFLSASLVRFSVSPFFNVDNENVGEPTTNATNIFHRRQKQNLNEKY